MTRTSLSAVATSSRRSQPRRLGGNGQGAGRRSRCGAERMTGRRFPKRLSGSSPSPESLVERVDQQRPGDVPGDTIPTGFPSIDRLLGGGLRRRDLVVLGGDIGSGKSALALGLALRVAQRGTSVALFSGEMDEERLMERALAIEGRVAVDELRGAIKQHADLVLGLYREEMYNPGYGVDGATELIVLKNRNGPTGFVDLYFYRRWMRFEDMLDPDR